MSQPLSYANPRAVVPSVLNGAVWDPTPDTPPVRRYGGRPMGRLSAGQLPALSGVCGRCTASLAAISAALVWHLAATELPRLTVPAATMARLGLALLAVFATTASYQGAAPGRSVSCPPPLSGVCSTRQQERPPQPLTRPGGRGTREFTSDAPRRLPARLIGRSLWCVRRRPHQEEGLMAAKLENDQHAGSVPPARQGSAPAKAAASAPTWSCGATAAGSTRRRTARSRRRARRRA